MNSRRSLIILGVILAIAVAIIWGLVWLSGASRLKLVTTGGSGSYSYRLTDQQNKTTSFQSSASPVEKRVGKGTYSLLVTHGNKSFYSIVRAKGFLQTTVVTVEPQSEQSRTFIGVSPNLCMYSLNSTLISYDCGNSLDNLKYHVPATTIQPPYAAINQNAFDKVVEGIFHSKEGNFVLLKNSDVISGSPSHSLYKINTAADVINLNAKNAINFNDLSSILYNVRPYKDGFVIYDSTYAHVFYYTSTNAKASDLAIGPPKTKNLTANHGNFDVSKDGQILTTYSTGDLSGRGSKNGNAGVKAEVVYGLPGKVKHLVVGDTLNAAQFCGTAKMCLLDNNNNVLVYDISRSKPKLMYKISSVNGIQNTDKGLIMAKNDTSSVIRLDVDSGKGFVEYSLGSYKFNRFAPATNGYIMSTTNFHGTENALLINQSIENTDDIDKKVVKLEQAPQVKSLAVVGNIIYVTPNLGGLVYNPALRSFDYSPSVVASTAAAIAQQAAQLGIGTPYKVVNPYTQ